MKTIKCGFLFLALVTLIHARGNGQERAFVLATYQYATQTRIENLEPLAAYLSDKAGVPVRAVSYPTVQALIRAIQHDSVDFAMINTTGYLLLQHKMPGKVAPLVNLAMGQARVTGYATCLIAGKSTGIRSLADLRDHPGLRALSLALVSRSSTSGHLMPRLLLHRYHLGHPEDVMTVRYAGTHRQVVEDVMAGKADIGGCGCAEIARVPGFEEKAVLLESFDDIPLGPIVYHTRVPSPVTTSISALLLQLHREQPAVFRQFCRGWTEFVAATHFQIAGDSTYQSFRDMFGTDAALWKLLDEE